MSNSTETLPETAIKAFRVAVFSPGDGPKAKPRYLGFEGKLWRLRIYHSYFTQERAEQIAEEVTAENPGYTASAKRAAHADGLLGSLLKKHAN